MVIYLVLTSAVIVGLGSRLGTEIFPAIDTGQFRLRLRAPAGTHIGRTEQIVLKTLDVIQQAAGPDNVELSLAYLGTIGSAYPINTVYQWMRGPEDAILRVTLGATAVSTWNGSPRNYGGDWPRRCRTCSSLSSRPTSSTR